MAETATGTQGTGMDQAFERAFQDVSGASAVQPAAEQVKAPVSGETKDAPEQAKPAEAVQPAQPAKDAQEGKPTEEKAAGMRLDDYTRKTQELAREREAVKDQVEFARAWEATAIAYNRATPAVQAEVKALLEGKLQPRSEVGRALEGSLPESVKKLLDSFEETDRGAVKDIFNTMLSEANAQAQAKIAELEAKLEGVSRMTKSEVEIRAGREADEAFAAFDKACPEWTQLSDRQRMWFQRDITEDGNLDPIEHFKSVYLPMLGSSAPKKEPDPKTTKAIERGSQSVLQPSTTSAAPRPAKIGSMKDAFERACADKGL